jgi:hypothetical protein
MNFQIFGVSHGPPCSCTGYDPIQPKQITKVPRLHGKSYLPIGVALTPRHTPPCGCGPGPFVLVGEKT